MAIFLENTREEILKEFINAVNENVDYAAESAELRQLFASIPLYEAEGIKIDDRLDVRQTINMMKNKLQNWYKSAVQTYSNLSDELNDIMVKIDDLLTHDKMARFKHGKDMVSGEFPMIYLRDKNNGKTYYFTYDQLYVPVEQITNWVDGIMNSNPLDYEEFKGLYTAVDEWYKEYHSFIDYTTPINRNQIIKSIQLGKALKASERNCKDLYTVLHNINVVVSNEIIYLNATQKAYDGLILKYKADKRACKEIDRIFKYCLAFTNRSMEWNMANFTVCVDLFKHYAAQIEKYYEIIKS